MAMAMALSASNIAFADGIGSHSATFENRVGRQVIDIATIAGIGGGNQAVSPSDRAWKLLNWHIEANVSGKWVYAKAVDPASPGGTVALPSTLGNKVELTQTMFFYFVTPNFASTQADVFELRGCNGAQTFCTPSTTVSLRVKGWDLPVANDFPVLEVHEGQSIEISGHNSVKSGPTDSKMALWNGSAYVDKIEDTKRNVTIVGDRIHYEAKVGAAGTSGVTDSFQIVIVDPRGTNAHSPGKTVSVKVMPAQPLTLKEVHGQTDEDATMPAVLDIGASVNQGKSAVASLTLAPGDQVAADGRSIRLVHSGQEWQLAYTPKTHFYGDDTIHFTVTNAAGHDTPGTATVHVAPVAPTAKHYATPQTVTEGASASIPALGKVIYAAGHRDGDKLRLLKDNAPVTEWTDPAVGTFRVLGDDALEFTPKDGTGSAAGTDVPVEVVLVHPGDADLVSNTVTAHFRVLPRPDATIGSANLEVDENSQGFVVSLAPTVSKEAVDFFAGSVKDSDDRRSAEAGHVTNLDAAARTFTYVPKTDFVGNDVVHVGVMNASGKKTWNTVNIHVVPAKPVAQNMDFVTVRETEAQAISNVNVFGRKSGNAGVIVKLVGPSGATDGPVRTAKGSVRVVDGRHLEYIANAGTAGSTDEVKFVLVHPNDGTKVSNEAVVKVKIEALGGLALTPGEMHVNENAAAAVSFDLGSSLARGQVGLHPVVGKEEGVIGVTTLKGGTLAQVAGTTQVTYLPAKDVYGTDTIHFAFENAAGQKSWSTVMVHIDPQAPVAQDVPNAAFGDEASTFTVQDVRTGTRAEGNTQSTLWLWDGAHPVKAWHSALGTFAVTADGQHIEYTARSGLSTDEAIDPIPVVLMHPNGDHSLISSPAVVSVTLHRRSDDAIPDGELVVTEGDVNGKDLDLHAILKGVTHVSRLEVQGGNLGDVTADQGKLSLHYVPHPGATGTERLTLVVVNDLGHTLRGSINVTVQPGVVVPGTWEESVDFNSPGKAIDVAAHLAGAVAQGLTATSSHGATLTISDMGLTYRPQEGFSGDDIVKYSVRNRAGVAYSASFTVHVATPSGDVPYLQEQFLTTLADTPTLIDVTAGAKDGPFKDLQIVSAPPLEVGRTTVQGMKLAFVPTETAEGDAVIGYTVGNRFGRSGLQHATIHINPLAIAAPLTASTVTGKAVDVDLTAGAHGGPFTDAQVVALAPAASGSTSVTRSADGHYHLIYRSNDQFDGTVTVSYTLKNAFSTSHPAIVSITVAARPDPTKDPDVIGLAQAQIEETKRFATTQIGNFGSRLTTLHGSQDVAMFTNGVTLTGTGAKSAPCRKRPDGQCESREASSGFADHASGAATAPVANSSKIRIWTAGAVDMGKDTAKAGSVRSGLRFGSSGLSLGADMQVGRQLVIGAGIGYGHELAKVGKASSRVTGDAWSAVLYADYQPAAGYYVDALVGVQRLNFKMARSLMGEPGRVTGQRSGTQLFGSLTAGYQHTTGAWRLSPYLRMDGYSASLNAYEEHGHDLAALHYYAQKSRGLSANAGFQADYLIKATHGDFAPSMRVEIQRDLQGSTDASMRYADLKDGIRYSTRTRSVGSERFSLELGTSWTTPHGTVFKGGVHESGAKGSGHDRGIEMSLEKHF